MDDPSKGVTIQCHDWLQEDLAKTVTFVHAPFRPYFLTNLDNWGRATFRAMAAWVILPWVVSRVWVMTFFSKLRTPSLKEDGGSSLFDGGSSLVSSGLYLKASGVMVSPSENTQALVMVFSSSRMFPGHR